MLTGKGVMRAGKGVVRAGTVLLSIEITIEITKYFKYELSLLAFFREIIYLE